MSRRIPLKKGYHCIVDEEDYAWLSQHRWKVAIHPGGFHKYAVRNVRIKGPKYKAIRMHRAILNAPDNLHVDHINGNGLDNRRTNLRLCTRSQNQGNARVVTQNRKVKGVSFHPNGYWVAKIQVNRKRRHLGCFATRREAALAYDKAALEHFGEFARLNFPKK